MRGEEGGRMRWSLGESVRRPHTHTHIPIKLQRGCCLNAWNAAAGLIKVKNKRGGGKGASGPNHVQQRRGRGSWNVPVLLVVLVLQNLEFNPVNFFLENHRDQ